jgi:hypothetical protein
MHAVGLSIEGQRLVSWRLESLWKGSYIRQSARPIIAWTLEEVRRESPYPMESDTSTDNSCDVQPTRKMRQIVGSVRRIHARYYNHPLLTQTAVMGVAQSRAARFAAEIGRLSRVGDGWLHVPTMMVVRGELSHSGSHMSLVLPLEYSFLRAERNYMRDPRRDSTACSEAAELGH